MKKLREINAPLCARHKGRGVDLGLRREWKNIKMTAIYYNPENRQIFRL
jgi:hypothetical protein